MIAWKEDVDKLCNKSQTYMCMQKTIASYKKQSKLHTSFSSSRNTYNFLDWIHLHVTKTVNLLSKMTTNSVGHGQQDTRQAVLKIV